GRQIEITVGDLPSYEADPGLVQQVWMNLIGNALKYTTKVATAQIEIGSLLAQNDTVVYYVRDNGAGFDMRYADKLFQMFQRLHRAAEFPGTGVGLATVARIVRRHGGRVWAEGTPGAGATF
ncbi:MAG: histidine kinase, partial [Candidatus Competibacteraceae bacterium]|nr:histidine kinase [Candidatus Competibacteraceae bacterium]